MYIESPVKNVIAMPKPTLVAMGVSDLTTRAKNEMIKQIATTARITAPIRVVIGPMKGAMAGRAVARAAIFELDLWSYILVVN
jgi:hypothetical protein